MVFLIKSLEDLEKELPLQVPSWILSAAFLVPAIPNTGKNRGIQIRWYDYMQNGYTIIQVSVNRT